MDTLNYILGFKDACKYLMSIKKFSLKTHNLIRDVLDEDFEYEICHGKKILILRRPNPKFITDKKKIGITWLCPFCGNQHYHGSSDGHRMTHCSYPCLERIVCVDGTVLYRADGYIIKTENE